MLTFKIANTVFESDCSHIAILKARIQLYLNMAFNTTDQESCELIRRSAGKEADWHSWQSAWDKCGEFLLTCQTITFVRISRICEKEFFARKFDNCNWHIETDKSKDYAETQICALGANDIFYSIPASVNVKNMETLVVQYNQVIGAV